MQKEILNRIQFPLIIYDGYCNLCAATVSFLIKTDKKKKLKFTALQSKLAAKLSKDTQIKIKRSKGVALYYRTRLYFKSEAIFKTFSILGGGYSIISLFSLLPLRWSNTVYDYISKNRYKWFGKRQYLHSNTKYASRFIDNPQELY